MCAGSASNPRRTLIVVTSVAASAFGLILLASSWYAQAAPAAEPMTASKDGEAVADERRGAGRLHAVLGDEQRDLGRAAVLAAFRPLRKAGANVARP